MKSKMLVKYPVSHHEMYAFPFGLSKHETLKFSDVFWIVDVTVTIDPANTLTLENEFTSSEPIIHKRLALTVVYRNGVRSIRMERQKNLQV